MPSLGCSRNVRPCLGVRHPRREARSVHGQRSVPLRACTRAALKPRGGKRKPLSDGFGRIRSVDSESRAVNIAIGSNILIFGAKVWVSSNSGSSALFAEAVHTLADIGNQLLLRFGIARSTKAPTKEYPCASPSSCHCALALCTQSCSHFQCSPAHDNRQTTAAGMAT